MKTESDYYSETFQQAVRQGKAEGEAKGEARGEVRMVLMVLDSRGIALTDEQRQRIEGTTDLEQLEKWGRRVGTVDSAGQLFD